MLRALLSTKFIIQDTQRASDFLKPGFVVQHAEHFLQTCMRHSFLAGARVCCERSMGPLKQIVILILVLFGFRQFIKHTDFGEIINLEIIRLRNNSTLNQL